MQQQVLRLRAQHHHWPTRNRGTKRRLIRLRPTKEIDLLWCNTDVGGPGVSTVAEGFVPAARPLRDCGPELQSARRSIDAGVAGRSGLKKTSNSPFPADYSTDIAGPE